MADRRRSSPENNVRFVYAFRSSMRGECLAWASRLGPAPSHSQTVRLELVLRAELQTQGVARLIVPVATLAPQGFDAEIDLLDRTPDQVARRIEGAIESGGRL